MPNRSVSGAGEYNPDSRVVRYAETTLERGLQRGIDLSSSLSDLGGDELNSKEKILSAMRRGTEAGRLAYRVFNFFYLNGRKIH